MVNDFGDLAWQRFGNDEEAEIFVRIGDGITQVAIWRPAGNRALNSGVPPLARS